MTALARRLLTSAAMSTDMAMNAAASGRASRSRLGFLMLLGLALLVSACGPQPSQCAGTGCADVPMCGTGCQSPCGCCTCTPGTRSGNRICTNGCYEPLQTVCSLPFEVGPCDALVPVYAYVNGACVARTYGGCEGNGNRFDTLEECLATCEGRPVPNGCPAGRIAQEICLACGPAGGCAQLQTVCALTGDADAGAAACASSLPVCSAGVCQNAFCH
jgi:hypothetical protein